MPLPRTERRLLPEPRATRRLCAKLRELILRGPLSHRTLRVAAFVARGTGAGTP